MVFRHALVLLTIAGGLGGVVAGTRHRVPPPATVAFADLFGDATATVVAPPPEPQPPPGPRLDGGAPDMIPVTGSTFDQDDKIDRHPVPDRTVTRSLFDDLDKVNEHPTGP
jgi:hypothetical protein